MKEILGSSIKSISLGLGISIKGISLVTGASQRNTIVARLDVPDVCALSETSPISRNGCHDASTRTRALP